MKKSARPGRRFAACVVAIMLLVVGCGGGSAALSNGGQGSGSGSNGGSGGSPGGGPSGSFEPRPFPGDFFFRLPTQDGGAFTPYEVYDPTLQELFVSNPDLNTVEVYSTTDGRHVGSILVPGPAGLSLSPDNSQLVIGTITPYVYFADPSSLHVTNRLTIPALAGR